MLAPATNQVLVLSGSGNGTLGNPQAFNTGGNGPVDVAAGDFVGDTSLDLAIANQHTGSVTFLQGDGTGSFVLRDEFTVGELSGANSLRTADFNKDGREDLALATGANVFVLLNTPRTIQVIPLVNGGFDAGLDGWTIDSAPAQTGGVQVIGGAAVLQEGNNGRVTLSQRLVIPPGATSLSFDLLDSRLDPAVDGFLPDAFEVSLLDHDGKTLISGIGDDLTAYANLAPDGTRLLGNRVTVDGNRVTLDLTGLLANTEVTLYVDLVTTGPATGSSITVDNFAVLVPPVLTHDFPATGLAGRFDAAHGLAVGDVDGDGRTDLVVTDSTGRLIVFSGDNQGGFARTEFATTSFGNNPSALAVGKLGADSSDDIAYSLLGSGLVVSTHGLVQRTDVTDKVHVHYYGSRYDERSQTVSFYATVTNTSTLPLSGSIDLVWTGLSPSGAAAVGMDGVLADGSPFFDLSALTRNGILAPGETTNPHFFILRTGASDRYTFDTHVMTANSADGSSRATQADSSVVSVSVLGAGVSGTGSVTAVVQGLAMGRGAWAGLFPVGAPDQQYVDWRFLDGTRGGSEAQTKTQLFFQVPDASGRYEIRVFAANSYARLGTSASFVAAGRDLSPPTVPFVTRFSTDTGESSFDKVTAATTLSFTWSASVDPSGVSGYWWAIDDNTPESGGTFTTDLSAIVRIAHDGPHTFYVRAVDASANRNRSGVSAYAFTVDTSAPQVVSVSPGDGSALLSGPRTIDIRFSEPMDRSVGRLSAGSPQALGKRYRPSSCRLRCLVGRAHRSVHHLRGLGCRSGRGRTGLRCTAR